MVNFFVSFVVVLGGVFVGINVVWFFFCEDVGCVEGGLVEFGFEGLFLFGL